MINLLLIYFGQPIKSCWEDNIYRSAFLRFRYVIEQWIQLHTSNRWTQINHSQIQHILGLKVDPWRNTF